MKPQSRTEFGPRAITLGNVSNVSEEDKSSPRGGWAGDGSHRQKPASEAITDFSSGKTSRTVHGAELTARTTAVPEPQPGAAMHNLHRLATKIFVDTTNSFVVF